MSFPRAKRFTETPSCAPPPGSYDPKFDSKVKGPVIEKTDRFTDQKGQVTTGENPNNSQRNGTSSIPVFRTPQPPKKLRENVQRSRSQTTGLQRVARKDSATDTEDFDTLSDDSSDSKRRLRFASSERGWCGEKMEDLRKELKACQSKCLSFEVAISELENEGKHLRSINSEMETEISKSNHLLLISEDKCSKLNTELDLLKKALEDEKVKYCQLKEAQDQEYDKLQETNRNLKEALEELKQDSEKLQNQWESELTEERAVNADLASKIAQKQQMILMLQSELSSLEVEFVDCKAERDKIICEYNTEKSALLCEYNERIRTLEREVIDMESRHSSEKSSLEEKFKNLEEEWKECQQEKTVLEAVLSAKEFEISELGAECEIQKAENEAMRVRHEAEILKLLGEFQNLEILICSIDNFTKECSRKMEETSLKYEKVIQNILQLHLNKVKEMENYMELRLEALQIKSETAASDLEQSISNLRREKADMEKKLSTAEAELQRVSTALTTVQNEIVQVSTTRDELRVSNIEQQLTIVDLQDKLDSVTVEHTVCKESLSTLKTSLEASEDQNRKFEVGNRNLRESLQALGIRLLESEKDVEQLTYTKNELETKNVALVAEVTECKKQLLSQEQQLEKLEKENLKQIEDIRKGLLEKVDLLKCKSTFKNQQMLSMKHEVDSFAGQLDMFTEKLQQVSEYVIQLECTSQEQNSTIQKLQTQLHVNEKELLETQKSLEKQVNCYEERVSQLSEALRISELEVDTIAEKLNHQKDCAQQQIDQLMQDLQSSHEYCTDSSQKIAVLERLNADNQASIENLSVQNADLKRNVEVGQNEIIEITLQLNRTLQKLSQCEAELSKLMAQRDEMLSQLSVLEKCKEDQLKEIADLKEIRVDKQRQIEEATHKIEIYESEIGSKDELIQELKSVINEVVNKYGSKKMEIAEQKVLDIENSKSVLISEVQQLKDLISVSHTELSVHKTLLEEKTQEIQKFQVMLQDMQNTLNSKQSEVECLRHEKNELYQLRIAAEAKLTKTLEEMKGLTETVKDLEGKARAENKIISLENMAAELKGRLCSAEREFTRQLQEYEERAIRAEKQCFQLEALVGPFRKELECFLAERGEILSRKEETEDELRSLALKYAQLLGHQNHKQKLKYVVQMQEKNIELREEVEKLRSQARVQKNTIDKLKSELAAMNRKKVTSSASRQILQNRDNSPVKKTAKGKENGDSSPVRHVPVGKENSPIHTTYVRNKENAPTKMSPVTTSTPKAFCERGNNV